MTHDEARTFVKEHVRRKGDKSVEVTEALIRYWWGVLNIAIFYGRLHKIVDVEIKRTKDAFGWAKTVDGRKGRVNIRMEPTYISKLLFLTVLAHEMVHAWEHQHHTVMGHGKRFYAWKNRIKRTVSLDLNERVNEGDYTYE